MSNKGATPGLVNLLAGHADYEVNKGIGPIVNYHGRALDLTQLTVAQADEIANDAQHRYVRFSTARMAANMKKALEEQAAKSAAPKAPKQQR